MVLDHLADQGIEITPYTNRLGRWLSAALGDAPERWPAALKRWWLYRRLGDVAPLEHHRGAGSMGARGRTIAVPGTSPGGACTYRSPIAQQ